MNVIVDENPTMPCEGAGNSPLSDDNVSRAAFLSQSFSSKSGPRIRVRGSKAHEINTSMVSNVKTGLRCPACYCPHKPGDSMLRSRWQTVLLAVVLLTTLGLYQVSNRRSNRTAERLRLENEYLSWDWNDTPEETICQSNSTAFQGEQIPRVVHFILIAEHDKHAELDFYQFLAIKAALLRIQPESVKIHSYSLNETNHWWQLIKHAVTLVIHEPHQTLRTIDGRVHKLRLPHQTDVLRLQILHQEGGIYLDTDVYALQSFSPLLQSPKDLLMGHEGGNRSGIGNAVIVARPGSSFIDRWLTAYNESFDNRPQMWNHHSVKVPAELATQHPEDICKLSPSAFFWPTWSSEHINAMHSPLVEEEAMALRRNMSSYSGAMYANQLAYHAWGNIARVRFLSQLTPESLSSVETKFNILLRDIYLAEV